MGVPTNNPTLLFSRDALRAIDRDAVEKFGIPSIVLMENAAIGVTERIHAYCNDTFSTITVVCGEGNNGGDGYATARHLCNHGYDINILQLAKPSTTDSAINEHITKSMNIPMTHWVTGSICSDSLIIDAIFGTGLNRTVTGDYADAINEINASDCRCISLDIPSGLDCDDGFPHGSCVQADETITFVGVKLGFEKGEASRFTGNVSVVDIGCPHCLLQTYGVVAT